MIMKKTKSNKLLSILIPTRNRAKNLDNTIRRIVRAIEYANCCDKIDVVVVNNFSSDNTSEVVKKWSSKFNFIKYYNHKKPAKSAEESLFHATQFVESDYIWCFGDDDYIKITAFDVIIKIIEDNENIDFYLLNCDIVTFWNKKITRYLSSNKDLIIYDKGFNLFKDFGLISVTTTISCLLFKKSSIEIELFEKISSISKIYSHSFFLFLIFYKKSVAFVGYSLLTYKASSVKDEILSISSVKPLGSLDLYSFNIGLVELINFVSKKTGINKKEILLFNEIEFNKQHLCIKHSVLLNFIAINFINDLKIFSEKNLLHKYKNINNLKFFIKITKLFFQEFFIHENFFRKKIKKFNIIYFLMPKFITKSFIKKSKNVIVNDEEIRLNKKLILGNPDNEAIIITNSKFYFVKTTSNFFKNYSEKMLNCEYYWFYKLIKNNIK